MLSFWQQQQLLPAIISERTSSLKQIVPPVGWGSRWCFHYVCAIYGVVKTGSSQSVLHPCGILPSNFKEEAEVSSTLFVSSLTRRLWPLSLPAEERGCGCPLLKGLEPPLCHLPVKQKCPRPSHASEEVARLPAHLVVLGRNLWAHSTAVKWVKLFFCLPCEAWQAVSAFLQAWALRCTQCLSRGEDLKSGDGIGKRR